MDNIKTLQTLVIIDMQNDFITGSLANLDAEAIIPGICELVSKWNGDIYLTRDTHDTGYLETTEGKYLPVKHCLEGTAGWCVHDRILNAVWERDKKTGRYIATLNKNTFGSLNVVDKVLSSSCHSKEVVLVGTCTDICVISNAILFKTRNPDVKVTVISDLCAGVTKEKHEAALEVMKSCQIEVVTLKEFLARGKKEETNA